MNQSKEAICPNHDMPNCLCKALLENYKKELVERVEAELEIQKKVQEKSKEVVAIGRARVAGMVAEKYTRIGKIEALSDVITLITEK
jgi:hypothetical protein